MSYRYDTFCGLYCGACPALQATKGGRLEGIAEEWGREPADLVCHGCKSDYLSVYCRGCEIRTCAKDKGLEVCGECEDFPCDRLQAFQADDSAHHSAVLANQERIGKVGLERWLAEQEQRWSCSCCWSPTTWYDERCPECDSLLYDCRCEECDLEEEAG